ncbi:tRNA adenosine(34) deaminase TadA [Gammaproteobacteria bacterium]|jgi:tRNA(adenine34) deaminase|nr:tRNA adenosine(34) deaminase TadA [Gammaproteobacteria bacterium]MDC0906732.1 tRNA adenosine(34) deaminase TadA [Gammaproteobacteria bacterium]
MIRNFINDFMLEAINMAKLAFENDEVPVGAVIVNNGEIIGRGFNQVIEKHSISSHAEINAINQASQFKKNYRLKNCDIYVTLEPCHMCAKAIVDARLSHLYYGAKEPKTGAIESIDKFLDREDINHHVVFSGGHMKDESSELLKKFFKSKRAKKASQKNLF